MKIETEIKGLGPGGDTHEKGMVGMVTHYKRSVSTLNHITDSRKGHRKRTRW